MVTQASGVSRWLTLNGVPLRFGPDEENLEAQAQEFGRNTFQLAAGAPDDVAIRVEGEFLDTAVYGRWLWRPGGYAGMYDVVVVIGRRSYPTRVRVLPGNLSQARYEHMLRQISQFSTDLLFQLHSWATERVSLDEIRHTQSPLRTYTLARELMKDLEIALADIARAPHRSLMAEQQRWLWHEVTEYSPSLAPVPGPVMAVSVAGRGPMAWPVEWREERQVLTYDVYENRLLKHFLWQQLLPRLSELEGRAGKEIERRQYDLDGMLKRTASSAKLRQDWQNSIDIATQEIEKLMAAADDCRQMQRRVMGWGSRPFLSGVSRNPGKFAPTQVLQKHPAYGRFYRAYLRFQRQLRRGLDTEGFLTTIAMRKMWELYQTWAALYLTALVGKLLRANGYETRSSHGFFRVEDQFFHFQVDRTAEIVYVRGEREVRIRYEPEYPAAATVPFGLVTDRNYSRTPDLTIELWENGEARAVVLFDPKYKTDDIDLPRDSEPDPKRERGPAQADLNKMSMYYSEIAWKGRGAIGRRLPQVVSSAYVLYPGDKLVHEPERPDIGAIPMIPEDKNRMRVAANVLEDLLRAAEII